MNKAEKNIAIKNFELNGIHQEKQPKIKMIGIISCTNTITTLIIAAYWFLCLLISFFKNIVELHAPIISNINRMITIESDLVMFSITVIYGFFSFYKYKKLHNRDTCEILFTPIRTPHKIFKKFLIRTIDSISIPFL